MAWKVFWPSVVHIVIHNLTNTGCNKWDMAEGYQQNHTGRLTVYSGSVHHMTEYIVTGGEYLSAMSCHQNYDPRKRLDEALREI